MIGAEPDSRFSPGLAPKVIEAASATASFAEASTNLKVLAEVEVSDKRIERWVTRIGNERIAQVDQQATNYEQLALPRRNESPVDVTPELVCIQVDGGRLQIRDRQAEAQSDASAAKDAPATFWRESKVGALLKMVGATYDQDPSPQIPPLFVDATRIGRLAREIKGFSGDRGETAEAIGSVTSPSLDPIEPIELVRPEPLVRSVVATSQPIKEFSRRLIGQAYRRGFMAAKRKAFVCDGMACNWTLHEKYFGRFTPILDFVHALCYIYHAAIEGQPTDESWRRYCQWAQLLWSGDTKRYWRR